MFSARILVAFAILVAVAALPTDKPAVPRPVTTITDEELYGGDGGWFSFPLFGNLFAPLWRLFPSFADFGPQITSDKDKFQVVVNVKDYTKEELKVKVKGNFIFVQGSHETTQDDHDIFASQFFHTYTRPINSSSADVTAELSSDKYLIVTAPLNGSGENDKDTDREVPIVETGVPYHKEDKNEGTTALAPSDAEDKKEQTTVPSDREEVTEKDNIIPHGNEIPL